MYNKYMCCNIRIFFRFQSDGNSSFLRAARAGNLEKVLDYLKGSIDINTSNAVSILGTKNSTPVSTFVHVYTGQVFEIPERNTQLW